MVYNEKIPNRCSPEEEICSQIENTNSLDCTNCKVDELMECFQRRCKHLTQERKLNSYTYHDFNNKVFALISNLELIEIVFDIDLGSEVAELNQITGTIRKSLKDKQPISNNTIKTQLEKISSIYNTARQKIIRKFSVSEFKCEENEESMEHLVRLGQTYTNLRAFLTSDIKINVVEYLDDFFDSYIDMLSQYMHIDLTVSTIDEIPDFYMYKEDIATIFEELIKNSIDSLLHSDQENKRISVRFSINNSDDQIKYLQIDHFDNGAGVASENQERIFQEDFTTKKSGSGKGLNGILIKLQRYSGTIELDKFFPEGAHFTIKIPILRSQNTCPTIAT